MNNSSYRYDELLSLDGGRPHDLVLVGDVPLSDASVAQIVYRDLPVGSFVGAAQWLRRYRLILRDQKVGQTVLDGVWRTVEISQQLHVDRDGDTSTVLVQKLAKGYYDGLDFSSAFVVDVENKPADVEQVPGNAVVGRLFRRLVDLVFRGIDPSFAVSSAISQLPLTYTDIVVGDGTRLDGVWHRLLAVTKQDDDGSYSVTLRLGQLEYVVVGFESHPTRNGTVYHVSGVPRNAANDVLSAWKSYLSANNQYGAGRINGESEADNTVVLTLIAYVANTGQGGDGVLVGTEHERTKFLARDVERKANEPNKLEAVELGPDGTITEVRSDLNETGLWDTTKETRRPREVDDGWVASRKTANGVVVSFRRGVNIDAESWSADWAVGDPVDGVAYTADRRMNEHGRYVTEAQKIQVTESTRPLDSGDDVMIYTWTTPYGKFGRKEYYHVKKADLASRIASAISKFNVECYPYVLGTRINYDENTDTYDIVVEAHPDTGRVTSSGTGGEVFQVTYTVKERQYHTVVDESGEPTLYYRDIQFVEGYKQSPSINSVVSFVSGQHNVHVTQIARNLFAGRYKTPTSEGQWTPVN